MIPEIEDSEPPAEPARGGWGGWLLIFLLFLGLRLPRLGIELCLKMDAANACNSVFAQSVASNHPAARWFCPEDYRDQIEKLRGGRPALYRHFPPLAFVPLGLASALFGPDEAVLRGFSIAMASLMLLAAFLFLRRLAGVPTALLGVFLIAACGQAVHYHRIADSLIINSFFLPLLGWLYLRQRDAPSPGREAVLMMVALFACLSDWNAYGVVGALALHRLCFRASDKLRAALILAAAVPLALVAAVAYFSLASGGFFPLLADFRAAVGPRVAFPMGPVFFQEIARTFMNYTPLFALAPLLWLLSALRVPAATRARAALPLFLLAGALVFPAFTRRVTFVHEYWTIWMLVPLATCAAGILLWLWRHGTAARVLAALALFAFLAQSAIIIQHRLFKYDSDYLLARHQGKTWRSLPEGAAGGLLITDLSDQLQILQYYSRARVLACVAGLEDLLKYEAAFRASGRREPLVFMTATATDILEAIPELRRYPHAKLTGEFNLREAPGDGLWTYLESRYPLKRRVGPYTLFILPPP